MGKRKPRNWDMASIYVGFSLLALFVTFWLVRRRLM
jgi:hypothetical protein